MKTQNQIKIKSSQEIKILQEGGKILSSIINDVACSLKFGITTRSINTFVEKLVNDRKVIAAFKGYRGFPSSVCISLNQEVVHGIPGNYVIQNGDVVSLDIGIIYKEYYVDMALTVAIGEVDHKTKNLLDVTNQCLYKGIAQAKVGNHLSDISFAVQSCAESHGFSVVRDFVGHGIGKSLHEDPEIPNYGPPHCGPILKEGMVFCIEPMINMGNWQTRVKDDGWTVETVDGKASAHFEHMIVVKESGPEILTK